MSNSTTTSLNRNNKLEAEETNQKVEKQQKQKQLIEQTEELNEELELKEELNQKLNQETELNKQSSNQNPLPPAGFPDDFPHHSINSDIISLTPQRSIPSTSSELLYHGTTVKKPHQTSQSQSTHRDSEVRKCWICYDDDDDQSTLLNSSDHPKSNSNTKKWVQACRCSLVAHESCLLTWITTYQLTHPTPPSISSPLLTPVKCPQCSSTYQISQPPSPVLSLIHRLRRPYHSAIGWCALGSLILGLGVGASSYGLWASRCFLGPVRWNRWIANPQHHSRGLNFLKFFQLSLVGPILILSRTKQLDSVLPFLPISLIFSTLPPLSLDASLDRFSDISSPLKFENIFPPEPGLTLCLIPWMRIGWALVWGRISQFIINREYAGMNYQYPLGLGLEARGPAIVEDNQNDQLDPIVANNVDPGLDRPGAEEEPNERAAAEVVLDYPSLRTILRIGMEALIWPGAASVVGSVLLLLSKNRTWLQTLLGLKTSFDSSSISNASYQSDHHQSSTNLKFLDSIKSSISRLLYKTTRLEFFSSSTSANHGPRRGGMNPFNLMSSYYLDQDEDPVWWRNTLGGSLLVIIKDLLSLVEKVLRLRKLKYRRILDVAKIDPSHTNPTATTLSSGDNL